jgi:hypothetical protein
MRLGVPFIAPRQLGAVESIPGRQFLPSVDWRTGQSGAPPDMHCSLSGADFFPILAQPTIEVGAVGAPDTVWCTPHSPVPPSDRWLCHASRTDYVADRWPGRQLAHRTVRCTPDSPVNFSRTPPTKSRERPFHQSQPDAPDTVRCTTGQSSALRPSSLFAVRSQLLQNCFSCF